MRELTLAVAKMTKNPLAGFENDASACYDRIVMNLGFGNFRSDGRSTRTSATPGADSSESRPLPQDRVRHIEIVLHE
jgi:hypothetical protein